MQKQKRALAVHDISCIGKCSLTVALPIISAAGIETSILPTSVLSTHTGGFEGFTYRDLTGDIKQICDHWKSLNIKFDAIYTGFLGSFEQIDLICELINTFKEKETLVLVDPVMADNGELYSVFSKDFPKEMKKLCEKADIIIPNITEACLMLDAEYLLPPYNEKYIKGLLKNLQKINGSDVVLTGVAFDDKRLGAAILKKGAENFEYCFGEKIVGSYHGTGDVFGSALLGALMNNIDLKASVQIAVDFTVAAIKRTKEAGTEAKYGVNFESGIKKLIKDIDVKNS